MLTVYSYQNCGTCRDARKWLDAKGIPYRLKAIRKTPPSRAELKKALEALGGDMRKLFNTSGMDYRELGLKDALPKMGEPEAISLLESNGNLVKRPFVTGDGKALVGFKKDAWEEALG
jgi:arsenate reductase